MTYFMRFIYAMGDLLTIADLEEALSDSYSGFTLQSDASDRTSSADLIYGDTIYGEIELNGGDDDLFREDIAELLELLEGSQEITAPAVRRHLETATGMVALQVSEEGHFNAERLDVLWDWLFETRGGLLQVDAEGFYDIDRLILPLEIEDDNREEDD